MKQSRTPFAAIAEHLTAGWKWLTPSFKLYLINNSAVLAAPYVPVRRPVYLTAHDKTVEAIDVLSIGASFTYDAKDDDPHSPASAKVDSWRKWFNATWDLLAQ